jgi:hypothetical protein
MLDSNDFDPIRMDSVVDSVGEAARQCPAHIPIDHLMDLRRLLEPVDYLFDRRQKIVSQACTLLIILPRHAICSLSMEGEKLSTRT